MILNEDRAVYDGAWRMVVIGPGPGPKNVWARREDGKNLVVPYSVWKTVMARGVVVYTPRDETNREVRMDAQVQIMQVSVRNTKTGKTVYDVACSDGKKRQVWEPGLATALNSYAGTGAVVAIRYDVTQNGQYTNESIQAFAPPGGQLPPDTSPQPMQQQAPMQAPVPMQQAQQLGAQLGANTAPIQAAPQSGGGGYTPEVTQRISVFAAYEHAATVIGGIFAGAGPEALTEATEALDALAHHIYSAARSHERGANQAVPQTPQQVAEFANAQLAPGTVQVGTPVAQQQDAAAEAPQAAPSSDVIDWN